jgi:hypothetical protein
MSGRPTRTVLMSEQDPRVLDPHKRGRKHVAYDGYVAMFRHLKPGVADVYHTGSRVVHRTMDEEHEKDEAAKFAAANDLYQLGVLRLHLRRGDHGKIEYLAVRRPGE